MPEATDPKPSKPGYKTTEFWLALAATIFSALWSSGAISEGSNVDKVIGVIAMILTALGYTVVRAKAKAA